MGLEREARGRKFRGEWRKLGVKIGVAGYFNEVERGKAWVSMDEMQK